MFSTASTWKTKRRIELPTSWQTPPNSLNFKEMSAKSDQLGEVSVRPSNYPGDNPSTGPFCKDGD